VTPRRFSASAAAYVERCKVSGMEELPNVGASSLLTNCRWGTFAQRIPESF
jgi:hypothetical protein